MSRQPNLWDTGNVISSPGSGDGAGRCGSPGGSMTGPCGRDHAPANLSARQAGERGLLTSGTYGRTGFTSSGSAGLQRFLESRLRQNLPYPGLTLFSMTWKQRVTPAGRLICALRASGRHTSGSGCGSWPTPQTFDAHLNTDFLDDPEKVRRMATRNDTQGVSVPNALCKAVKIFSPWPTPSAQGSAGEISEDLERVGSKWVNKKTGRVLQTNLATDVKMLAPWPTPMSAPTSEASHGQSSGQYRRVMAECAPWPTPTAHPDGKSPEAHLAMKKRMGERDGTGADRMAITDLQVMAKISGIPANGCPAGTANTGQLNPAFSLWLMGYPAEWDD